MKGKLDKPVEFGRTMELVQDDSGVIVHYEVHQGNPSDKIHLLSLVRQTKKVLSQSPQELAADRGFYSAQNLLKLRRLKVRRVGIPKIGRLTPSETQHQRTHWFRELQRFRCGIEACISMLKRQFGLGKVLASRIVPELESASDATLGHDSSTNALIRRYRRLRAVS